MVYHPVGKIMSRSLGILGEVLPCNFGVRGDLHSQHYTLDEVLSLASPPMMYSLRDIGRLGETYTPLDEPG